jgi:imidazolonepropionase-like amidohydrolase
MNKAGYAFQQIRVIDGLGRILPRATVLVKGDRIAAVGDAGRLAAPRGAVRIDGRGLTLLPGLMDCHVHLCLGGDADVVHTVQQDDPSLTLLKAARHARQTLEAGFTTVRDVGFRDHSIFHLKHAIESGLLPGPRIAAAGRVICMPNGHARFIGQEAEGPGAVVAAVQAQLDAGAEVVKFIASGGVLTPGTSPDSAQMTPEELAAGMTAARRAGRRVAAHAHSAQGMKNAIRAGAHSIEHATLMDEEAASLMKTHGVYMVPTLSALATTAGCGLACGVPETAVAKAKAMVTRHKGSFKMARRAGIAIAMGTDAGTPFNLHGENAQELERMVALGMTPMDALVASTSAAARLIGIDGRVGTIEPGKLADLVLVRGNPLSRITLLRDRERIVGVMQAGKFVAGPLAEG